MLVRVILGYFIVSKYSASCVHFILGQVEVRHFAAGFYCLWIWQASGAVRRDCCPTRLCQSSPVLQNASDPGHPRLRRDQSLDRVAIDAALPLGKAASPSRSAAVAGARRWFACLPARSRLGARSCDDEEMRIQACSVPQNSEQIPRYVPGCRPNQMGFGCPGTCRYFRASSGTQKSCNDIGIPGAPTASGSMGI